MNDLNRADRIRDIIAVYRLADAYPALPLPFTGPDRVSFYFIDRVMPAVARESVASARQAFAGAFGVTFEPHDEWGPTGAQRQFVAALPSGLKVVLVAKAEHMSDEDVRELQDVAA